MICCDGVPARVPSAFSGSSVEARARAYNMFRKRMRARASYEVKINSNFYISRSQEMKVLYARMYVYVVDANVASRRRRSARNGKDATYKV